MVHPSAPSSAVPPASVSPGPGDAGPRMVDLNKLPYSLRGLLSWLPESEWHLVQGLICHGSLSREIVEIAKFVDAVWTNSLKAEDRRSGRVTGAERDAYRDGVEEDLRDVVTRSVALGKRSRLTEILQRSRPLIVRYVPEAAAKPAGRSPGRSGSDQKVEGSKSPSASQLPAQAGPEFLNRWLSGIRRIRQSDPSFARAQEVVSMFEKALEISGPRRAEVEHMLAQYREAVHRAGNGGEAPNPAAPAQTIPEAVTGAA